MASLTTAASTRPNRRLWITGGLLCACAAALAALAMTIGGSAATPENRRLTAAWGVTAGLVYFVGLWASGNARATTRRLIGVLAIGLAMRAAVLATPPFLEVDYRRYLWDGAVTAHGLNPYERSPAEALASLQGGAGFQPAGRRGRSAQPSRNADDPRLPEPLRTAEAMETLARVNHPRLTTVYGPVAQAAFATAHRLAPWSPTGWRAVLLLFDLLTVGLVLALLRMLGASPLWAAWYWWNPLLLREVFSSGHMDLLALPLVLLASCWRFAVVPSGQAPRWPWRRASRSGRCCCCHSCSRRHRSHRRDADTPLRRFVASSLRRSLYCRPPRRSSCCRS